MYPWGRAKCPCIPSPKSRRYQVGLCHDGFKGGLPNLSVWTLLWCYVQFYFCMVLFMPFTHLVVIEPSWTAQKCHCIIVMP